VDGLLAEQGRGWFSPQPLKITNTKRNPVKALFIRTFLVAGLLGFVTSLFAADAKPGDPQKQLQEVIGKVQAKLREGKKTEQDFADELKQFDALLQEHEKEKTDDVAQILLMKAIVYLQVIENTEKARELIKKLKTDFPQTKQGKQADEILANIEKGEAAKKIQQSLAIGAKFPDFNEKDVNGKPLSIANYKGKVVLVDFWATWCGPCIGELPNVLAAYEKHHKNGFEIVGISLDKDLEKLKSFTTEKKMTWQQYFDGLVWENKLAGKYGVVGIPATYLLDGNGTIIGKDLRGEALEKAVATALAKK
jgi:peroxiredoxin